MLVLVHSCIANFDRLIACEETWADEETVFVVANPRLDDEAVFSGNTLLVRAVESYDMLPMKTYLSTKWAYERGVDHFLKCDDDTYVHHQNLAQLQIDASYIGHDVGPWGYTDCSSYASGGGGYVLGREAMACIVDNESRFVQPGAEDYAVGKLMLENNLHLRHEQRFNPSATSAYKITDEMTVHLHRLGAEAMRAHHRKNLHG